MVENLTDSTYIHRINAMDIIVTISENWLSFAQENSGDSASLPDKTLNSYFWNYIGDPETKHLYKIILQKVRKNKRQVHFPFRCDSPGARRFMTLTVVPHEDNAVDFISHVEREELREPVQILGFDAERSDEFLRICSMCKKIATSDTEWDEVEIAIQKLKLFEKDKLPQFTHGVCKTCFDLAMAELDQQE